MIQSGATVHSDLKISSQAKIDPNKVDSVTQAY